MCFCMKCCLLVEVGLYFWTWFERSVLLRTKHWSLSCGSGRRAGWSPAPPLYVKVGMGKWGAKLLSAVSERLNRHIISTSRHGGGKCFHVGNQALCLSLLQRKDNGKNVDNLVSIWQIHTSIERLNCSKIIFCIWFMSESKMGHFSCFCSKMHL